MYWINNKEIDKEKQEKATVRQNRNLKNSEKIRTKKTKRGKRKR